VILYKYVTLNTAMLVLENTSIAFTCAEDLNDPFETTAFGFSNGDIPARTAINAYKSNFSRNYALLSLTRQPLNALMWSHYCDSHQGAVIGIDIEAAGFTCEDANAIPAQFGEVIYTSQKSESPEFVPSVDELKSISRESSFNSSLFNFFKRAFLYKSLEWAYEEEVRVVKTLRGTPNAYHSGEEKFENKAGQWEKLFVSSLGRPIYNFFLPEGCIKEIYFGNKVMNHVNRIRSISIETFQNFKQQCLDGGVSLYSIEPDVTTWNLQSKKLLR